MLVRAETPADIAAIAALHTEAFGTSGNAAPTPETRLVEMLRQSEAWIPALSLVAVVEGDVVGHCVCTRAHVDGQPVLALGPIGVLVDFQGRGVGTALMNETIDTADRLGEVLIGLLGDPAYYQRFGFVPSSSKGVKPPDPSWGDNFQVLTLAACQGPIVGGFVYPDAFAMVT